MPVGTTEIGAQITIQEFFLKFFGMQGSNSEAVASIPFRAYGPPGTATLENLQYSVNGSTPADITLVTPPAGMEVGVSPAGTLTTLIWDLGADFGVDFFNQTIVVTANLNDGTHTSPTAIGSLYVPRVTRSRRRDPIANDNAVGANLSVNILKKKV